MDEWTDLKKRWSKQGLLMAVIMNLTLVVVLLALLWLMPALWQWRSTYYANCAKYANISVPTNAISFFNPVDCNLITPTSMYNVDAIKEIPVFEIFLFFCIWLVASALAFSIYTEIRDYYGYRKHRTASAGPGSPAPSSNKTDAAEAEQRGPAEQAKEGNA